MRRWVPVVVVLALLTGCGHPRPPHVEPMVYDVVYGVVVGPGDLAGYTVRYTDDDGNDQSETVPPGQNWAHRSTITSSPGTYIQLEVLLQPVAYPNGYPKIQCRVDVNHVMIGGAESTKATCRVFALDADIKRKLAASPTGSPGGITAARR